MHPTHDCFSSMACRLCLQQDGFMLGIFNHIQGKERSISKKISDCTALQIAQGDGLPHIICHRCLYKIEFCLEFRQQCCVSDATLRRATEANCTDMQPPILQPETQEPSVVMVVDPNAMDYESETEIDANMPMAIATLSNEHASDNETNDGEYKNVSMCIYCDKAFSDKMDCARHESAEHDHTAPFKCGGCEETFLERVTYALHVKSFHRHDKPYSCPECERSFARRSDLRKHTIVHTGIKPYTCPFCYKAFSRNTNLSKHIRIHTDQKTYSCNRCSQAFHSKSDLTRHSILHTGAKPHTCELCHVGYMRKDKLVKHMKSHSLLGMTNVDAQELKEMRDTLMHKYGVVGTYQEPEEAENVPQMEEKTKEESEEANPKEQTDLSVNADKCEQDTKQKSSPPSGSPIKEDEQKSCEIVNEDVTINHGLDTELERKSDLNVAELVSTALEEIPSNKFPCTLCNKNFTSEENLQTHMGVHDEGRPFVCADCSHAFLRRREYERHLITHTGVKEFQCETCLKQFSRKDKLLKHSRTHSSVEEANEVESPTSSVDIQSTDPDTKPENVPSIEDSAELI